MDANVAKPLSPRTPRPGRRKAVRFHPYVETKVFHKSPRIVTPARDRSQESPAGTGMPRAATTKTTYLTNGRDVLNVSDGVRSKRKPVVPRRNLNGEVVEATQEEAKPVLYHRGHSVRLSDLPLSVLAACSSNAAPENNGIKRLPKSVTTALELQKTRDALEGRTRRGAVDEGSTARSSIPQRVAECTPVHLYARNSLPIPSYAVLLDQVQNLTGMLEEIILDSVVLHLAALPVDGATFDALFAAASYSRPLLTKDHFRLILLSSPSIKLTRYQANTKYDEPIPSDGYEDDYKNDSVAHTFHYDRLHDWNHGERDRASSYDYIRKEVIRLLSAFCSSQDTREKTTSQNTS